MASISLLDLITTFADVDEFHGRRDPEDPLEAVLWINRLENVFQIQNCIDRQKVEFAIYKLTGYAYIWWKRVKERKTQAQLDAMTWEEFKELFLDWFFPQCLQDEMEQDFFNIEQEEGESVAKYGARFQMLSMCGTHIVGIGELLARRFVYGLRLEIKKYLIALNLQTYADARNRALSVEMAIDQQQQMRGRLDGGNLALEYDMERDFLNIKQEEGESVVEYEARFDRLSKFATDIVLYEKLRARLFRNGLRWNIKKYLIALNLETYADVVDCAKRVETVSIDFRRRKGDQRQQKRKRHMSSGNLASEYEMERAFLNIEQEEGESVAEYEARFDRLSKFATCVIPDEERHAHLFEYGLRWNIRKYLIALNLQTYADVVDRAQRVEMVSIDLRRRKGDQQQQKRGRLDGGNLASKYEMERDFLNIKQEEGESVAEYKARFDRLSKFATYVVPDERRRTLRFQYGLRWNIREHLIAHEFLTYAKVVDCAQRLEMFKNGNG